MRNFVEWSLLLLPLVVDAFSPTECHRKNRNHRLTRIGEQQGFRLSSSSNNEETNSNSNSKDDGDDDDDAWLSSLRARQQAVAEASAVERQQWRSADCQSGVALALPGDWIRRIDVAQWPLIACGSASGTIHVANLETGETLATSSTAKDDDDEESQNHPDLAELLPFLYGSFDGGGTLAVAFTGNLIVAAGRRGGVQLWRWDPAQKDLISQGPIPALEGSLVTALKFQDDELWVGTSSGSLQMYPVENELPLALQAKPTLEWKFGRPVLSLDVDNDMGIAVASTTTQVHVVDVDSDDDEEEELESLVSFQPPLSDADSRQRKSTSSFVRSVALVSTGDDSFGVACGGSHGTLYWQALPEDISDGEDLPRIRELKPQHFGRIQAMTSPLPHLVVCAAQDGRMSIWDVTERTCLYQFVGYKVWVGSVWSDGLRLVSDGADNTVIVHNFDPALSQQTSTDEL